MLRLTVAVASCALAAYIAGDLIQDLRQVAVARAATSLERGEVGIDEGSARMLLERRVGVEHCDTRDVAVASVMLSRLDAAYSSGDRKIADEWADASWAQLKKILRCRPYDGNAWLRLGMIAALQYGDFEQARALTAMSWRTTPSEWRILLTRLRLALEAPRSVPEEVVVADLKLLQAVGLPGHRRMFCAGLSTAASQRLVQRDGSLCRTE